MQGDMLEKQKGGIGEWKQTCRQGRQTRRHR
ncbi:hypothetical protein PM3016_937 [Paenibacillus mucilaginosus 3016]|uniref:Uncharacterized protein n=1 Tax=Paenibacillus mucilaginosus 3016 TaxID=1116391 RepID=H6NBS9_9BACL|nr:hypothetical protein PM3016_937 [Paenibacillus mucilaginosus 3016]